MRIGAVTLAYNDQDIISGTINSLKPFVDKHIVLISEMPYFGDARNPDGTEQLCMDLGVDIVKGNWELDHYQRNIGNIMCGDCDWVLGFDSDEMMTKDQMEKFLSFLGGTQARAICNRPEVYWKSTKYVLRPIPDYAPVIAMRPDVRFTYIRNVDSPFVIYEEDRMHHLSWCSPKDIKKKVECYAHAPDYDWIEWYNNYYTKWDFSTDASVVFPSGEPYKAIYQPLPDELKNNIMEVSNV